MKVEAKSKIRLSKGGEWGSAGLNKLCSRVLFKLGDGLIKALTSFVRDNWNAEIIPISRSESLVVPIMKKVTRRDCSHECGINLLLVVTKILASIIMNCLLPVRNSKIR